MYIHAGIAKNIGSGACCKGRYAWACHKRQFCISGNDSAYSNAKFMMASPLYRQEQEWKQNGILLSRQTMSNWLIKACEEWLEPIYEKMKQRLCSHIRSQKSALCHKRRPFCRNCHRRRYKALDFKEGKSWCKVREIANYSPKFLYEEEKNRAKEYMKKYSVEALPILDKECNIVSVVLWNDEQIGPKKIWIFRW